MCTLASHIYKELRIIVTEVGCLNMVAASQQKYDPLLNMFSALLLIHTPSPQIKNINDLPCYECRAKHKLCFAVENREAEVGAPSPGC